MSATGKVTSLRRPLSSSDTVDLWAEFQACDCDGDGCIVFTEFDRLLEVVGSRLSQAQRRAEFGRIDLDANGRIDLGEFERWWQGA